MSNWMISAVGPMPVESQGVDVTEQARRLLIEAGWIPPDGLTVDEARLQVEAHYARWATIPGVTEEDLEVYA